MLDKYKDNDVLLFYIKFSDKFGCNLFEFINKDNLQEYFSNSGVTEKLKQYMKNNPDYTKDKISSLVHNDQVLNNVDDMFISIFEYYIINTYFNNNKPRYNYLLEKLGPSMLFHLGDENTLKLIQLNDYELSLIFDTIKCCKYDIVPSNITYDNIIISLCDFVFKRKHNDIVNITSIIRSDLMRMKENELEMFIEYNLLIKDIIKVTNCDKKLLMDALIECRNLQENKLRTICREYLVKCEKNFLDQNKDTILEQFGVKKIFDKKDALKKLGDYYKLNITFEEFKKYCQIFTDISKFNSLENNTFIDSLKMTKEQFNKVLSITEEEFNLIKNSMCNNTKPDDLVKEKFRYLKMFLGAYASYKYDHDNIDTLLNELNVLKVSSLKLEDIDMFEILRGLDIDIYLNTVCKDNDILNNLKSVFQNKFLGRIPKCIGNILEREYQIKLPGGINNIGSFMTKYSQILKEEQKRIKNQGGICDKLSDIKLSFVNIIATLSAINSETKEVRRLIGKSAYNDFIADPNRNSSNYSIDKRQNKLILLLDYLYSLNKITIPSKDIVMSNKDNSKKINIIIGNRTNESNICHGERTGACMRVGGAGEGLFLKCLTDKNWFHIRFEDPNTHEYISRVSGFRNGNTVYLNQLRDSSDDSKYSNSDLQEFITIYAKTLIEDTKNSKYPIENVFINTNYAMKGYSHEEYNGKVYTLGNDIKNDYNLEDVEDYRLRDSMDIWTDVSSSSIILATTDEGKKTKDGYVNIKNGVKNTDVYDVVRDKIYGIYSDEDVLSHRFITCDNERLMEVINRVHGMKEKLMGKNYKYEIEDIISDDVEIIDGYGSSDFYVYIDSNYKIHSDCIEYINKDNELIPYGQADRAKAEMEKYMERLKNKYIEIRKVI